MFPLKMEQHEEALIGNLKLLNFEKSLVAKENKVALKNDMFRTPNQIGFECVFYFLFNKLDSGKCEQVFRCCWPIIDRKVQAKEFLKECKLWIAAIAEGEPATQLPKHPGSILVSPYGKKFYRLASQLSIHVLQALGPPTLLVCFDVKLADLFQRLVEESVKQNKALYDETREEHQLWKKEYEEVVNLNLEFIEELKMEKSELQLKIEEAEKELGDEIKSIDGEQILNKLKLRWAFLQPILEKERACADFIPSILSPDSENALDFHKLKLVISDTLLERAGEVGLKQEDIDNLYDQEQNVNLKPYIRICNATLKLHLMDHTKFLSKANKLDQSLEDHLKRHAIIMENMKLLEKLRNLKKDLKSSIEEYSALLAKNPETSQYFVNYQMPQTPPYNFRPGNLNESLNYTLFDFQTPRATSPILKKKVFEFNNSMALTPPAAVLRNRVETPPCYTPWQRLVTELSTPKGPSCNNSNSGLNAKRSASKCFDLPQGFSALFEENNELEEEISVDENIDPVVNMDNFLEKSLQDFCNQRHSPSQNLSFLNTKCSSFQDSLAEDNEESLGILQEFSSFGDNYD